MSIEEFVHFIYVLDFTSIKLFIPFPYYPFNVCRICSDVSFLFPGIDHLHFFFFLVSLVARISILLSFKKNTQLLPLLIFLYCLSSISLIVCLYLFISIYFGCQLLSFILFILFLQIILFF